MGKEMVNGFQVLKSVFFWIMLFQKIDAAFSNFQIVQLFWKNNVAAPTGLNESDDFVYYQNVAPMGLNGYRNLSNPFLLKL